MKLLKNSPRVIAENRMSLTREACDEISGLIEAFCKKEKVEKQDRYRYRLSAEECLLEWILAGYEGKEVVLRTWNRRFGTFFSLELEGDRMNPYESSTTAEFGPSCNSILVSLNLRPEYRYINEKNLLTFRVKKRSPGMLQILSGVLVVSVLIGILGLFLIPAPVRQTLLDVIIIPLYDTFFKLLGCAAGPMIFLSVLWGIVGIGDMAALGRIGNKMMRGFVRETFLATAFSMAFFPLLAGGLTTGADSGAQVGDVMKLIFDIFPSSIIEPFSTGNTLQIIFLSVVIGIALLYLGDRVGSVISAVEQINLLISILMKGLGKLIPAVIFMAVLNLIWSGSFSVLTRLGTFVVILFIAQSLVGAFFILYTAWKQKISVRRLIKKAMPAFLLAFSTASSAAAMSTSISVCNEKYGIDSAMTGFGLPLGTVMHKPIAAIEFLLLVLYFAGAYDIPCTITWIVTAVLFTTIIAIATPPVAGGGAIALSILFLQMKIPSSALAIALTIDMLADFPNTAFSVLCLHMNLINLASGLDLIDRKKLKE